LRHTQALFPIDYLGAGILSAASASIGKSHKLEVKHGWEEKVNLFMVIVGQPETQDTSFKILLQPYLKSQLFLIMKINYLNTKK
jgi:hypothetical protein